ncbi:hypothetical protein CBF34_07340 [Vagococcus penaei]|uniref:Shikimate kinase n=1 Tax=Vagococcus penaei TaxID=633807 RepID=A0A1Q2D361_9ENTE|nr:shikimate kinase [Vagococcus penaei]AQP52793.1 hypothetical protein BW732_00205 [Vagococcus penaei]RSU01132.1 hypothetical protein CBF34_07340 [Vagococcus penaei]
MSAICLIGFMGVGKTTIGRRLAQQLELPFIDLDRVIEEELNLTIPEIFTTYGEDYFRQLESQLLVKYITTNCVLATGGGIVINEQNRMQLKQANWVFYLQGDVSLLHQRLKNDRKQRRPLAQEKNFTELERLFNSRRSWYHESSTNIIKVDGLSVLNIVKRLVSVMEEGI